MAAPISTATSIDLVECLPEFDSTHTASVTLQSLTPCESPQGRPAAGAIFVSQAAQAPGSLEAAASIPGPLDAAAPVPGSAGNAHPPAIAFPGSPVECAPGAKHSTILPERSHEALAAIRVAVAMKQPCRVPTLFPSTDSRLRTPDSRLWTHPPISAFTSSHRHDGSVLMPRSKRIGPTFGA
jgi:hypothetical protein